jgi:uncharacterized membrane protein
VPRNANEELKKLKNLGDKVADELTRFAGSMTFVYVHTLWFGVWIIINLGVSKSGSGRLVWEQHLFK